MKTLDSERSHQMANSKKAQTKVVGTTIQAMVDEGKALKEIWEKRLTSQRRTFTSDTNAKGFDTRLGKLLQQLKASSSMDSGQISRQVLTTHGLHVIDRRRRSEALWFVENEVECREFIKASKKGFTSLTALQAAMRKASKEADTKPAKAEKVKATPAKAEPSNVGQSPTKPASKQDIFDKLVKVCEFSGIDMLEIAEMIIDHSTAPTVTEVAA
tara:strand:- start:54 stop:695 length:642 start_codon:yes stop_codon:yes gene_type:complete